MEQGKKKVSWNPVLDPVPWFTYSTIFGVDPVLSTPLWESNLENRIVIFRLGCFCLCDALAMRFFWIVLCFCSSGGVGSRAGRILPLGFELLTELSLIHISEPTRLGM